LRHNKISLGTKGVVHLCEFNLQKGDIGHSLKSVSATCMKPSTYKQASASKKKVLIADAQQSPPQEISSSGVCPIEWNNRSWVDQNLNFVQINVTEYILLCYAYSEHVLTRKAITQCQTF
jgi:hypothetical protein